MTTDLLCLLIQALWGYVLVGVEITAKTKAAGPAWNAGNRERSPEVPEWVHRCTRALNNHKENFPLFLTVVVIAHLTGHANDTTALACIAYVVMRVLHAALYIGGVTGLRSLAHVGGLVAIGVLVSQLF